MFWHVWLLLEQLGRQSLSVLPPEAIWMPIGLVV
jgi:hypothetical protein